MLASALRSKISVYAPVIAAVGLGAFSLPERQSFSLFLSSDAGANLAATMMSAAGGRANVDFGYPFGPLSLGVQRWSLALIGNPTWSMTALTLLATLLFGLGASWAIARLRLGAAAVALLTAATAAAALSSLWPPVYTLEAAMLLWALVLFAAGERAWALTACVVAALLKPTMGVVVGALFVAECLWRLAQLPRGERGAKVRAWLLPPAVVGVALSALLMAQFGWRGFWRMAIPLAGARNYRLSHFSFFSIGGNPFFVRGMRIGYFWGTTVASWGVACVALAVMLGLARGRGERWYAAFCGLAGTLAFLSVFYSWRGSYCYYLTMPVIGLALLAGDSGWKARSKPVPRGVQLGPFVVAGLVLLGNFTAARDLGRAWRRAPTAATAGLWSTAAEAREWADFAAAEPPARHPLLLIGSGSAEAVFPSYGAPWHAFMYAGEATAPERAALRARAEGARCAALADADIQPRPELAPVLALRPRRRGPLFDTFGCVQ